MKKEIWMSMGLAAALPIAGVAAITINAYAQDGAVAYLYDSLGNTYGVTTFLDGSASIDTSGLVGLNDYALAVGYAPGQAWYSNIAWADGGGGQLYKTLGASSVYEVESAIVGAVTDRQLNGATASVTLSADGPIALYDNDVNELDAEIGLYRPAVRDADVDGTTTMTWRWNASSLAAGYTAEVNDLAGSAFGLKLITISDGTGFNADYAAADLGGGDYLMYFLSLDKAYAYTEGRISNDGLNDVIFEVDNLGTGMYDFSVPYYVMMERAWIYDVDGNYSEAYDAGLSLTNPQVYLLAPNPVIITGIERVGNGFRLEWAETEHAVRIDFATRLIDGDWSVLQENIQTNVVLIDDLPSSKGFFRVIIGE